MTDCKVNYVDVIAHTGSVRSRVIIAEDTETFQLADSNLCDIRIPFRICHVQVS